jgi:hypothetical protein
MRGKLGISQSVDRIWTESGMIGQWLRRVRYAGALQATDSIIQSNARS